MKVSKTVFGAVATLSLASCGGGRENANAGPEGATTAGGAAAASTDPCSLVTAEEVGEIIGDKVVSTEPRSLLRHVAAEGHCTYHTADAPASSVTIELDQSDAAGKMEVARTAAGVLKDMGGEAAREGGAAGQEVNAMLSDSGASPKIGDDAFFGANSQLNVRKGNSYIAVSPPIMRSRMREGNPMLSSGDKKAMAMKIAQKAIERLP